MKNCCFYGFTVYFDLQIIYFSKCVGMGLKDASIS